MARPTPETAHKLRLQPITVDEIRTLIERCVLLVEGPQHFLAGVPVECTVRFETTYHSITRDKFKYDVNIALGVTPGPTHYSCQQTIWAEDLMDAHLQVLDHWSQKVIATLQEHTRLALALTELVQAISTLTKP